MPPTSYVEVVMPPHPTALGTVEPELLVGLKESSETASQICFSSTIINEMPTKLRPAWL